MIWRISQVLKNQLESAMVNEPSVFESLKFYCIEITSNQPTLLLFEMDLSSLYV